MSGTDQGLRRDAAAPKSPTYMAYRETFHGRRLRGRGRRQRRRARRHHHRRRPGRRAARQDHRRHLGRAADRRRDRPRRRPSGSPRPTRRACWNNTYAYVDPRFHGGVRVAAADINGDGNADIITGAGPGGGPHVRVVRRRDRPACTVPVLSPSTPTYTGGVYVAAGDIVGDGKAELAVGSGVGLQTSQRSTMTTARRSADLRDRRSGGRDRASAWR